MAKSIKQQINDIKMDVGNICHRIGYEFAKNVTEDLSNVHRQIIENYYSSYSPRQYSRNGSANLYETIHKIKPGKTSGHQAGKQYLGGIEVGGFGFTGYHNIINSRLGGLNNENILDLMWNQGIRGLPAFGATPATVTLDDGSSYSYYWTNPYFMRFVATAGLNGKVFTANTPHVLLEYCRRKTY